MLDLNQGIYEHFLRRRGDNSTFRYWLLAGRGLWEDVPEDGDKNKFQPSAWAECAGRTKTTNLHHHQEGSSGVEEIACEHVADRRNFVGRWRTEATKTTIRLWSDSRRRHVHHMSHFCRVFRPLLVRVNVGRFCMATALFPCVGLRFVRVAVLLVEKRNPKPCRMYCEHYWANRFGSHSFSVDWVSLLKARDVLKASMGEFSPLLWRKCT